MTDATTMTSKGQVTVPREIRDRLGLKSGDRMAFTMLSDGTVVMRPKTRRLLDLAGSLTRPGQPSVAIEDMHPFQTPAAGKAAIAAKAVKPAKAVEPAKLPKKMPR